MSLLLSPHEIKGMKLKNRVVMSPMCMHMAADDGFVTEWHRVHYGARALDDLKEIIEIPAAYTRYGSVWLDTKA
jgi:2,4-dienoyl-CoA reductase-like NADH-dependent reductase (Old Yellow Enzyme family)